MELPLKLLVTGDFSNGQEQRALSEREKVNVNKNNFDSVLAEFSPALNISVENTLAGDGSEENVRLTFRDMKDFTPEQVARQIPSSKPCWQCATCCATSRPICWITSPSARNWKPY